MKKGGKHSEETKEKMSKGKKNKPLSAEHRAAISKSWEIRRLVAVTEETRAKISKSLTDRIFTDEHRANLKESILKWHNENEVSEQTKKKMSEGLTGRVFTDEHRANLKEAAKNRLAVTEQTRDNMSESQLRRYAANPVTEETKQKQREVIRPPVTEETKKKISVAVLNFEKLCCPHCGKWCDPGNSAQWHFDMCGVRK